MVQLQPDIYILPSLLLPYFSRNKNAEWTAHDIIETNKIRLEKLLWIIPFYITKRLLLVDDEQELLKMVSDILKDAGFETVLTAMTVKEAILTAKEETPDLIVLDVMLPDGDGFSLMQHFRTFTNVSIIFLTAKDEAADKLSGLGLGADDYIF